jgi:homoserine kinase
MALDIWNETIFSLEGSDALAVVTGEGAGQLPQDETNLILQSALRVYELHGKKPEPGLLVRCFNQIPIGSGLGSSAAAALTGVLGANALLGDPLTRQQVLDLVTEIEHHPDNAGAALEGGLVVASSVNGRVINRPVWDGTIGGDVLQMAIVMPEVSLTTKAARVVLPKRVSFSDAVQNLAMTALVIQVLQMGDLELLGEVMVDKLHQPYRLPLIPGAREAIDAARQSGAAAAVLSGAGPSVIAFGLEGLDQIANAMQKAFSDAGKGSRKFVTSVTKVGAAVLYEEQS